MLGRIVNWRWERWFWMLAVAGLILRLYWFVVSKDGDIGFAVTSEADDAAAHFARHGVIGDVFGRGSGPSAHLSPVMPLIAGTVMRQFGVGSLTSNVILGCLAYVLICAAVYFWCKIMRRLGLPSLALVVAMVLVFLVKFQFHQEFIVFRTWEAPLAVLLASAALYFVLKLDARTPTASQIALLALISALALLINPAAGLACAAVAGLLMLWRMKMRQIAASIGIFAVATAVVLAPWTIRNWVQFDRFIPLRSNSGLELAVAYFPAAIDPVDHHRTFQERLVQIHPNSSQQAFEQMRAAGGEIAYANQMGQQAKQWMADHPTETLSLILRHGRQYWFPDASMISVSRNKDLTMLVSVVYYAGTAIMALLLVALNLGRRRWIWLYPAVFLLSLSLPYFVAQPIMRYRYLIYIPTIFLASAFGMMVVAMIWRRVFAGTRWESLLAPDR